MHFLRKLSALGLALGLVAFHPSTALAASPRSELQLLLLLNGVPTLLGTITADATTAKNELTTAVPFALTGYSAFKMTCDVAAWVYTQATATAANGDPLQAGDPYYFIINDGVTVHPSVLARATGAINCKVWGMK